jgi:hypothetical protein
VTPRASRSAPAAGRVPRRGYGRWGAAGALALVLALPGGAAGQSVEPGGREVRTVGALAVTTEVMADRPQVRVTLDLAGQRVGQAVLMPDSAYRFDVEASGATASGDLTVRRVAPPLLSRLDGAVSTGGGAAADRFRGSFSTWVWPETLPWTDTRYWLGPELNVRTRVATGPAGQQATVTLLAGDVAMYEVVLIQASPVAVLPAEMVLGGARVAAGTSFILTVATPLQQGQVMMQGRFQTRTTPDTPITAVVATWTH